MSSLLLLLLLVLLCSHAESTTITTTTTTTTDDACERAAPMGWAKSHRQHLCAHHPTALGPARCASRVKEQRIPSISSSIDLTISLCENASSEAPATCALAASSSSSVVRSTEHRIALCRGAQENAPVGAVKCINYPSFGYPLETRLALCQGATGPAPMECFVTFPLERFGVEAAVRICRHGQLQTALCVGHSAITKVDNPLVLALCANATSEVPALCFQTMQKSIPQVDHELLVQLCAQAMSLAPATCVQETLQTQTWKQQAGLLTPAQTGSALVSLCAGGSSSPTAGAAPAQCLAQAASLLRLDLHDKIALCQGALSIGPVVCARAFPSTINSHHHVTLALCQGTAHAEEAEAKAACFTQAPYGMTALDKAILCKGAFGNNPAACAKIGARHVRTAVEGWEAILNLCQHAANEAPAACFANAPLFLSVNGRVALCRHAQTTPQGPPSCAAQAPRHLPRDAVVRLCASAVNAGPAQCLRTLLSSSLGSSLTETEQLGLCQETQDDNPALCARDAPLWLSPGLRARLCTNTTTGLLPARCAHLLPSCYASSPHTVLRMCQGATSMTPVYCFLSTHGAHGCTRPIPEVEFERCRHAVSRPAALRLLEPEEAGPLRNVEQGRPFNVHLALDDQYGQFRQWDTTTMVRAWLGDNDNRRSEGNEAFRRPHLNLTRDGKVSFMGLRLLRPGAFWLHFDLQVGESGGGGGEKAAPLASFPIDVAPAVDAQRLQECLLLFEWSLELSPEDDMHLVPWPQSLSLASRGCLNNAFPGVAVAWAHDGSLWVTFTENLWRLATGFGVPTRDMPFHERLGVDEKETTSRHVLRRAYYRQSLLWHPDRHPDRWAGYPHEWRMKARTAFGFVAEAYEKSAGGGGGNGGGNGGGDGGGER